MGRGFECRVLLSPRAGDLWHMRGSLPVEPLNAVMERFADWERPTLMIPGNHDQVGVSPGVSVAASFASPLLTGGGK